MVDASEKLSNDHAHDAQARGLAHPISELGESILEFGTLGEIESLAGQR